MTDPIVPEELLQQWETDNLTVEATIGHLLQHLCQVQIAIEAGNISLYKLHAKVDSLISQFGVESQFEF